MPLVTDRREPSRHVGRGGTPMEDYVYKQDSRSRVWRADSAHGPVVVKRFEYSRLQQWLAWLLRIHPAQRERAWNRRLANQGFPVLPIVDWGISPRGISSGGGKFWLASPARGESLYRLLTGGQLNDWRHRRVVLREVGNLTGRLLAGGFFFRDLRASNILVDQQMRVWLIDVGSIRRSRRRKNQLRTLAILDYSLQRCGVSRTDRLRVIHACVQACTGLGGVGEVVRGLAGVKIRRA